MRQIIDRVGHYRKYDWSKRDKSKIKYFAVHHSATKQAKDDATALANLRDIHYKRGWRGLSYHYVIPRSGKIYKINDIEDLTWTVGATYNRTTLSVCLEGYFHAPFSEKPTNEQLQALEYLLNRNAKNLQVVAHRDLTATACCGDLLYKHVKQYKDTGKININMSTRISTTSKIVKDFLRVHPNVFSGSEDYVKLENTQEGEGVRQMIRDLIQTNSDLTAQVSSMEKEFERAKAQIAELENGVILSDTVPEVSQDSKDKIIDTLEDTIKEQEKEINQIINGVYQASQMEKWSWNKFWVGLNKYGVFDGVFGFGIAYLLSLSSLAEFQEYGIYLGLGVSFLKSLRQNVK